MSKKTCDSPEIKNLIAKARVLSEKTAIKRQEEQEGALSQTQETAKPSQAIKITNAGLSESTPSTGLASYVNFQGFLVQDGGRMTKTGYLDRLKLSEEQYGHIQLTEEQAVRISRTLRHMSTGINAAVPIACTGPRCPFANSCPFEKESKAPIGLDCIVETQLINYWTTQYLEEFNVDPESLTEIHLVSELAEFNIYEMRITKYIATNHPDLMQTVAVGVDNEGNPIENIEISRAFDLKEKIKKNRLKVLEALSATRKEKIKLAIKETVPTSLANTVSDVKRKLEQFKRDMEKLTAVDGEVVES